MIADATLAFGRRAAEALLGLDALFRRESGDPDGLVVLNLDAGATLEPARFRTYDAARDSFTALLGQSVRLAEPDRRVYYEDLCLSSLAFIGWRSEGLDFRRQLAGFLHVPAEPAGDAALAAIEAELGAALSALGYDDRLAGQCAAWEERQRIPAERVPEVLADRLERAWSATAATIGIPADPSDAMRGTVVEGAAFNARCDYLARTIELNTDPVLTGPGLTHLAVHEGYPGHYLQFKRRELAFAEGRAPADVLLSVVNTASSSTFEGIADHGLALLGWLDDPDLEIHRLLNRHRAGLGTEAAWRLHALGWSIDRVADWLRARALVGGEGWVGNRMRFIAAPARAVLIWSYWWGETVVATAAAASGEELRGRFVSFLYDRMHSNRSVAMFDSRVAA